MPSYDLIVIGSGPGGYFCANGADIAARPSTDDDEIVGHDNHLLIVIAGLVPAIPVDRHGIANLSEMAGTSPA